MDNIEMARIAVNGMTVDQLLVVVVSLIGLGRVIKAKEIRSL